MNQNDVMPLVRGYFDVAMLVCNGDKEKIAKQYGHPRGMTQVEVERDNEARRCFRQWLKERNQ